MSDLPVKNFFVLIGHAETHVSFLTFDLNKDFGDENEGSVLWGVGGGLLRLRMRAPFRVANCSF